MKTDNASVRRTAKIFLKADECDIADLAALTSRSVS